MASTGEVWRLGHRPALDGLRGIAVLLVLAYHLGLPGIRDGGGVGVGVFFTLSGFLITTLLLGERSRTGRINVRRFYARRARRLLPAMLACVLLAVGVDVATRGHVSDWGLLVGTLTYTSNFVMQHQLPNGSPLSHTWSLAVEEQFYVLWPLLLTLLYRWPARWKFTMLGLVSLLALEIRVGSHDWRHMYFGLDTRADGLLIGCMLAMWMEGRVAQSVHWSIPAVGVLAILPIVRDGNLTLAPVAVSLGTAAVLFAAAQDGCRWLTVRPLVEVGRRSYGVYLYHAPLGVLVATLPRSLAVPVILAGTTLLTYLSYHFLEEPIRRRRVLWARSRTEVRTESGMDDRLVPAFSQ